MSTVTEIVLLGLLVVSGVRIVSGAATAALPPFSARLIAWLIARARVPSP